MADLYDLIADLRSRGEPAALATIVRVKGSSPGKESMKMLVRADGLVIRDLCVCCETGCSTCDLENGRIERPPRGNLTGRYLP